MTLQEESIVTDKIISRAVTMIVLMILSSITVCKISNDISYNVVEKYKADSCYTEAGSWNDKPKVVDYCGGKR